MATSPTPSPDADIIEAVSEWFRFQDLLQTISDRLDKALKAHRVSLVKNLDKTWDETVLIADGLMMTAVTTPATTPEGIAAKIRLYRATKNGLPDGGDYGLMYQPPPGAACKIPLA
jgi:hypothetical protein